MSGTSEAKDMFRLKECIMHPSSDILSSTIHGFSSIFAAFEIRCQRLVPEAKQHKSLQMPKKHKETLSNNLEFIIRMLKSKRQLGFLSAVPA